MFRLTRLLSLVKPICQITTFCMKQPQIIHNNFMKFSTQIKHKIYDMIAAQDAEDNFDKIVIELGTMSDKNREQALKFIISQFYESKLSPKIVVHPKLNIHLKKYPSILFDAYHFRIVNCMTELMIFMQQKNDKASKIVVKDINDAFVICFQAIKKITVDIAGPKEIQLYKLFGHYHFHYLAELVDSNKIKTCLTKSKDFFKASLTKAASLIKTLNEKKSKLANEETSNNESKQAKEKRLREIASNQILLDDIIQGYGEVVFELIVVNTSSAQSNQTPNKQSSKENNEEIVEQDTAQFSKQVLQMQPLIEKAVKNYQLSQDCKVNSKHYHKLKKTLIDIRFQKKNQELESSSKLQEQRQKLLKEYESEFIKSSSELYEQTLSDFKKLDLQSIDIDDIVQFTTFLVSLKQNPVSIKGQKSGEQIYNQLGQDCRYITSLIENDKIRQMVVIGLISDIKTIFGVDISKFLQKIPRSFKYNRKGRRIDNIV